MGGASGGVLGMLEVIQSDFARLEAETQAAEEEASNEYDRFSAESAQDKAVKSTDLTHKDRSKSGKEQDLAETTKDLKATQAELDAALAYYEKLKPSCVDSGLSYSDRVKRREEEIQSLKEALRILEGEDIA
jgi:septation ring formation regulator EzrA